MIGKQWLPIFGIILVALLVLMGMQVYILQVARGFAQDALSPIKDSNAQIQTQVAVILNPTPTIIPDPVTIINQVRSLARLETIQYSVEKIITAEVGQGAFAFLLGDKLLLVAHGTVIAGIDLARMTSDDLDLRGKTLYVHLPEPEIFISTLDNDRSYVYDRETGILTKGNINLETVARQAAEDQIEKAALEDGILAQARINAEAYLVRLFTGLGYPDVVFSP